MSAETAQPREHVQCSLMQIGSYRDGLSLWSDVPTDRELILETMPSIIPYVGAGEVGIKKTHNKVRLFQRAHVSC